MMRYFVDGLNIFYEDEQIKTLIGPPNKTETIRIDDSTVADVSYQFDLDDGVYVEQSRVTRNEPLPPVPPTQEEQINELKSRQADILIAMVMNDLM